MAEKTLEADGSGVAAAVTTFNPVETLMRRMDNHDKEGEAIDAELAALSLTRKKINSIRSTKKRLAKEQALLAELTGAKS